MLMPTMHIAMEKSSTEAFDGSCLSCAGGAEYSSPGITKRTLLIPRPTCFIASTITPFSFTSIMFECLPISSQ